MHSQPLTSTITTMQVGDEVLALPAIGITLGRGNGPDHSPVLVCENTPGPAGTCQVTTTAGTMRLPARTPATFLRENTVRPDTPLLLSRRISLHAVLLSYGIPLVRRSPAPNDQSAPELTGREWGTAPLILMDGYLSMASLRAFAARPDIQNRAHIIMIGDDPDDARIYTRAALIGNPGVAVLPYQAAQVLALLHAASPHIRLHAPVADLVENPVSNPIEMLTR